MSADLSNVIFIIWRESVEALLVVGILNAWIGTRDPQQGRRAALFLWSGVVAGLALAVALAAALALFGNSIPESSHQTFQTILEIVAAALILQMVFWMRRHGRTLKRDLENSLTAAATQQQWWGVFILALVAVAREGSEAVLFLYGTLSATAGANLALRIAAVSIGLIAAIATYLLLQIGSRHLSWRLFFRVTEFALVCLAGALLVTAADNLVALDYLPEFSGRLWDTSAVLPDTSRLGALIAALTGYRARPDATEVVTLAAYWAAITWMLFRPRPVRKAA